MHPPRKNNYFLDSRKTENFFVNQIHTERYRKSAIPEMLRLLNEEDFKINQAISNLSVTREPCLLKSISEKI